MTPARADCAEAERQLAAWMLGHSFSTGHGDTLEDLLEELSWQIAELRAENERLRLVWQYVPPRQRAQS